MTILVTGSAGHLGEALMRVAPRRGPRRARPRHQAVALHRPCRLDRRPRASSRLHGRRARHHPRRDAAQAACRDPSAAGLRRRQRHRHAERCSRRPSRRASRPSSSPAPPARSARRSRRPPASPRPGSPRTSCRCRRTSTASPRSPPRTCASCSHRRERLPVIVLRTSRFFPEADDDASVRGAYDTANLKANELLYRRVDIADVVGAHLLALDKAPSIGFGTLHRHRHDAVLSATTSPRSATMRRRSSRACSRSSRRSTQHGAGGCSDAIDRVYVNAAAVTELGWRPNYDFASVLDSLRRGEDFRSPLARDGRRQGLSRRGLRRGPLPGRVKQGGLSPAAPPRDARRSRRSP